MTYAVPLWLSVLCCLAAVPPGADNARPEVPLVFATFAQDGAELANVLLMAGSIRTFGGALGGAPIRVYVPETMVAEASKVLARSGDPSIELRTSTTPEDAGWFYYAAKVFAAGRAEAEVEGSATVLAWLDEDTVVLGEPSEFILPDGKTLGYRPVMHKNVGLLYDEPLDGFWGRAFGNLAVPDSAMFPMVTPADGDTIRPYFNAGCLVVRPERGLLRKWVACFPPLYRDSLLTAMCREDVKKRIFIHQVALTGAILTHLRRDEMIELSDRINYPVFFRQMFGSKREFNDITGVITIRHETFFGKLAPGWHERLKGPADRIAWMAENLQKNPADASQ